MSFAFSNASQNECALQIRPRAGISLATPAFAIVTIDYLTVGNAGNTADPATGSLYGAVSYEYQIGKYEVTNAQYAEFLNAKGESNSNGIYNPSMSSYGITQSGSSGPLVIRRSIPLVFARQPDFRTRVLGDQAGNSVQRVGSGLHAADALTIV